MQYCRSVEECFRIFKVKRSHSQVPGVEGVTASYETPEFVEWGDGITVTDEKGKHEISLNAMPVDLDFTKTMKMQLIAGRDFQQSDFSMMDTTNNNEIFTNHILSMKRWQVRSDGHPNRPLGDQSIKVLPDRWWVL